jgi:hypothetical protein
MVKRKITVTVDESLVEAVQALGAGSLSGVVNAALAEEVDRRARSAALGRLLADWEEAFGPVPGDFVAEAVAAFDDLDATAGATTAETGRQRRKRGAA